MISLILARPLFVVATSAAYDLLVIGSGSAGIGAAKYAAKFGKTVALIEKARYGGDCTWTGCIPSKTLIASAKRAHAARTASKYGVHVDEVRVDMREVKARINSVIKGIYEEDDSPEAFEKLGITAICGAARFVDPSTLAVKLSVSPSGGGGGGAAELTLTANDGVLIATGARPVPPKIEGIDSVEYLTYESVFELEEVPRQLTVVGGGPIGCELAQVPGSDRTNAYASPRNARAHNPRLAGLLTPRCLGHPCCRQGEQTPCTCPCPCA